MQIGKEALDDFVRIYEAECGVVLSKDEAAAEASLLIDLVRLLSTPVLPGARNHLGEEEAVLTSTKAGG